MTYDYARAAYYFSHHYKRYIRFVNAMLKPLICQECGGSGGETVPILDDGSGPFEECGWCLGTGLVTAHLRGEWLRYKKADKYAETSL
jgi:hypothetical protein